MTLQRIDTIPASPRAGAEDAATPEAGARPLVLVVDDDALQRAVLADMVGAEGLRVSIAAGTREAMSLIGEGTPAVVLSDLEMPDGGGLALCEALGLLGAVRPHVIVVSAHTDTAALVGALDAGADDYLRKPVVAEELRARLRVGLRTYEARVEAQRLTVETQLAARRSAAILEAMEDALLVTGEDGRVLLANRAFSALVGLPMERIAGASAPHPWLPDGSDGPLARAIEEARRRGHRVEADFLRPDGTAFPVEITPGRGRFVEDGVDGRVVVIRDISERRRLEAAVAASATEQWMLRRISEAVARQHDDGEVHRLIAEGAAVVLGAQRGLVCRFEDGGAVVLGAHGGDPWEAPGVTLTPGCHRAVARVRETEVPALVSEDGPCGRTSAAAPVTVDGRLWGTVLASTPGVRTLAPGAETRLGEFAELLGLAVQTAEARAHLVRAATTDPLTRLANRRTFEQRLAEEIAACGRTGAPLALVMLDIDRFKRVNDTHGHQAGDVVIEHLSAVLRRQTRGRDLVARVGGEEFALLLPDCGADDAVAVAERIREGFGGAPLPTVGSVTCSCGVAVLDGAEDATGTALVGAADAALYEAKRRGRDRVVVAGA